MQDNNAYVVVLVVVLCYMYDEIQKEYDLKSRQGKANCVWYKKQEIQSATSMPDVKINKRKNNALTSIFHLGGKKKRRVTWLKVP